MELGLTTDVCCNSILDMYLKFNLNALTAGLGYE